MEQNYEFICPCHDTHKEVTAPPQYNSTEEAKADETIYFVSPIEEETV